MGRRLKLQDRTREESGATDPADRLANALTRIAYALDRAPSQPGVELQTIAANIDALRVRIRTSLEAGFDSEEEI